MDTKQQHPEQATEPLGIIIAGWPRAEIPPRVRAYVWGPAPEPTAEELAALRAA